MGRGQIAGAEVNYTIRPCRNLRELAACVTLQKKVWGYADVEVYPLRLFVNLERIGGVTLGAFTPGRALVGFVAATPAWHGQRRFYHSLSLGVLPEHENRGLGRRLKLAQCRAALKAGIALIEWTFDPLRAKNAFFNIQRLGAIARRYYSNLYGPVASRLQQGLPTDRLVVEWWLSSTRVRRALHGQSPRARKSKPAAEVAIPADARALVKSDPKAARAYQRVVRQQLLKCFGQKLVITGFVNDSLGCRYVLDAYEN